MKKRKKKKKRRRPSSAANDVLANALELHQNNRLGEARVLYERLIKAQPNNTDMLYLLGRLYHSIGKTEQAIPLMQKALSNRPNFEQALNDLGNMLHETGYLEDAASVFQNLLRLNPQHADAHNNLGVVYKGQRKYRDAVKAFSTAIELNPNNVGQHYNLGNVFRKLDHLDEAIEAYRHVLKLQPNHTNAYQSLAATLRKAGKYHQARAVFKHWLQQDPNNAVAQYMLAVNSNQEPPERAPDNYVRQVFDQFASSFDEELQELDYRGPFILSAAIAKDFDAEEKPLVVLDAGCGTGLCGPILRGYASKLVGVDLSPAMLDKADQLGIYDELVESEITAYLETQDEAFDLIACVDTISYFGNLQPVLSAMAQALRSSGWLMLTCEKDDGIQHNSGYRLGLHGRFSHSKVYLERCLIEAGLNYYETTLDILRREAGKPVEGMVVRAWKRSS